MEKVLLKLKRLLNSIEDEELKEMDLWIDNERGVEIIALDGNAITLVTEERKLKIDGRDWWVIRMNRTYYVIVNLDDLCYMRNGANEQSIVNADKFESYLDVKAELKNYDEDFNGAIYEVNEYIERYLKRVREGD